VSKAFTRESDDPGEDLPLAPRAPLPPGVKNYVTPAGAQRLRDGLASLLATKTDEDQRRDARVLQLQEIIASLVIAEPPAERDVIRFGATVMLRRGSEPEDTYRLVGVDEIDLDRNDISWLSPLARALIGRRAGDHVLFRSPSGLEEITVLSVRYE
jgi:transcription elongation factor GreB